MLFRDLKVFFDAILNLEFISKKKFVICLMNRENLSFKTVLVINSVHIEIIFFWYKLSTS